MIRFKARIRTETIKFPIIEGTRFQFQIGYHTETGTVRRILAELNEENGAVIKTRPRMIGERMTAVVVVHLEARACMETVANFEQYSRIQLLYEGAAVAFGKVTELID